MGRMAGVLQLLPGIEKLGKRESCVRESERLTTLHDTRTTEIHSDQKKERRKDTGEREFTADNNTPHAGREKGFWEEEGIDACFSLSSLFILHGIRIKDPVDPDANNGSMNEEKWRCRGAEREKEKKKKAGTESKTYTNSGVLLHKVKLDPISIDISSIHGMRNKSCSTCRRFVQHSGRKCLS